MEIKTTAKVWGNSIGIILPKNVVQKLAIRPKEEIVVSIRKKSNVMQLFGTAKLKRTAQEMKDEARKGWQ